jgi:hypothetical protein
MSFVSRHTSRYAKIDLNNPQALAVCDQSDFVFNHKDLVKQMTWVGNNLVWTGLMVGKPFLDIPNQQARPPKILNDPKPIKNPRLPQNTVQDTLNWGSPGIASSQVQVNYTDPEGNPALSYNQMFALLSNVNFITGNTEDE